MENVGEGEGDEETDAISMHAASISFLHPLIFENCVANQFTPQIIQAVAPNPTLFRPRPFIIQRPMQ